MLYNRSTLLISFSALGSIYAHGGCIAVITLGIFQTGMMPTDLLFCNQCKVVKVVHGNQSDNHCNQSDTWPSTTTRALLLVLVLVV